MRANSEGKVKIGERILTKFVESFLLRGVPVPELFEHKFGVGESGISGVWPQSRSFLLSTFWKSSLHTPFFGHQIAIGQLQPQKLFPDVLPQSGIVLAGAHKQGVGLAIDRHGV